MYTLTDSIIAFIRIFFRHKEDKVATICAVRGSIKPGSET